MNYKKTFKWVAVVTADLGLLALLAGWLANFTGTVIGLTTEQLLLDAQVLLLAGVAYGVLSLAWGKK